MKGRKERRFSRGVEDLGVRVFQRCEGGRRIPLILIANGLKRSLDSRVHRSSSGQRRCGRTDLPSKIPAARRWGQARPGGGQVLWLGDSSAVYGDPFFSPFSDQGDLQASAWGREL